MISQGNKTSFCAEAGGSDDAFVCIPNEEIMAFQFYGSCVEPLAARFEGCAQELLPVPANQSEPESTGGIRRHLARRHQPTNDKTDNNTRKGKRSESKSKKSNKLKKSGNQKGSEEQEQPILGPESFVAENCDATCIAVAGFVCFKASATPGFDRRFSLAYTVSDDSGVETSFTALMAVVPEGGSSFCSTSLSSCSEPHYQEETGRRRRRSSKG